MNLALILAGGTGARMGSPLPKQFLSLGEKPVLLHSVDCFLSHSDIDALCIVCGEEQLSATQALLTDRKNSKPIFLAPGGQSRRESSLKGLSLLAAHFSPTDTVLIHDAARPLVSQRILTDCINCVTSYPESGGCTTAIPVQDTILMSGDGQSISSLPDRRSCYSVQTPQAFLLGRILAAHQKLFDAAEFTDDAGILLSQGWEIRIVNGEKRNLKLTSPEDMTQLQCFLSSLDG